MNGVVITAFCTDLLIYFIETLDTELTVSDLPIVLEKLFKARTKWYEIGLQLGVPNEFLRSLSVTNIGAEACLREMLADRLQTSAPLTWRDLCVSLRSPLVGHQDVAEEIEFRYISFKIFCYSAESRLSTVLC